MSEKTLNPKPPAYTAWHSEDKLNDALVKEGLPRGVMVATPKVKESSAPPPPTPTPPPPPLAPGGTTSPGGQCVVVIDVRTESEWEAGHVSCAWRLEVQNRPNGWQAQVATMTAALKSTRIILYCNSGVRAEAAKMVLEEQGYTAVTNGGSYADRGMMENECAACAKWGGGGGTTSAAGRLGDDISFDFSNTVKQAHPGNGMESEKSMA